MIVQQLRYDDVSVLLVAAYMAAWLHASLHAGLDAVGPGLPSTVHLSLRCCTMAAQQRAQVQVMQLIARLWLQVGHGI